MRRLRRWLSHRRPCGNCREVDCACLPLDNWVDEIRGAVAPAVQVVRRVSRVPVPQLRLPAWDHREIYSSI